MCAASADTSPDSVPGPVPNPASTPFAEVVRRRLDEAGLRTSEADIARLGASYDVLVEWRQIVMGIARESDEPIVTFERGRHPK